MCRKHSLLGVNRQLDALMPFVYCKIRSGSDLLVFRCLCYNISLPALI